MYPLPWWYEEKSKDRSQPTVSKSVTFLPLQDGDKVVIADLTNEEAGEKGLGPALLAEKYGTKVYSIITDRDVEKAVKDR